MLVASYKQQIEFFTWSTFSLSGDIGDPYTYWAADLSNKHFAYSIDVHQVQSHLTFFISDNKSMADVDTFFSISGSAAIANTTQRQI